MNTEPSAFRRALAHRILALLAVAAPAAGLSQTGCFTSTSGCGSNYQTTDGFVWPSPDGGGGGAGGSGGMGGSGGGGSVVCPSRAEAKAIFASNFGDVASVDSDGTFEAGQCHYTVTRIAYCEGRPFMVESEARTAEQAASSDAREWLDTGPLPVVHALSEADRARLADAFAKAALFEHASVASFGRFALELLAVGAPGGLVEAAHKAALDEVRHARLCFALASAYAGKTIAPAGFPFDGRVDVSANLADVAARTVREGCLGETIAACVAAEQAAAAQEPAVREALSAIAADEAKHAELAFKTVAWALRVGGPDVHEAVSKAIELALVDASEMGHEGEPGHDVLAAHGQIGAMAVKNAISRARKDVVEPAAKALLSRSHSPLESTPLDPRSRS